jgi:hypothetical protein
MTALLYIARTIRSRHLLAAFSLTASCVLAVPTAGWSGHPPIVSADDAPPVTLTLDSLDQDTVVAGSGATITIQCTTGCDDQASVSVGDEDITDDAVAYDPANNTETFALPDDLPPGTYDVTVTEPDGQSDTLSQSLLVEPRLSITARVVTPHVKRGTRAIVDVQTNADDWSASVTTAQGHRLPNTAISIADKDNGLYRISVALPSNTTAGLRKVILSATLGSQTRTATYTFTVVP